MLLQAISQYFAQENLRVKWEIQEDQIMVTRIGEQGERASQNDEALPNIQRPVPLKSQTFNPIEKPSSKSSEKKRPPLLSTAPRTSKAERPDWVDLIEPKNSNSSLKIIPTGNPEPTIVRSQDLLTQPFEVTIPSAKSQTEVVTSFAPLKVTRGDLDDEDFNSGIIGNNTEITPNSSLLNTKNSKNLTVTPYPVPDNVNQASFYNDAPSIVQYGDPEKYLDWETRMQGALLQGNQQLLQNEKRELERRLQFLKDKLR